MEQTQSVAQMKQNQPPLVMEGPKFESNFQNNGLSLRKEKWGLIIITILLIIGGFYLYNALEMKENLKGGLTATQTNVALTDNTAHIAVSNTLENTILEKAVSGEGVTHLARRALKNYLSTRPELAQNLTAEHKIYIEDYLKINIGARPLELGEEISFSYDLINQAIIAAQGLNQNQLNNLSQYTLLVNL